MISEECKKIKIAQVVCVYPPYRGGIGNAALHFFQELRKTHSDTVIFTPDYGRKSVIKEEGVERLRPILQYGNGAFLPQLFWRLPDYDVVILHYPFFGAAEIVCLAKLFFRKKFKLIIYYHMDVVGLSRLAKILSWPTLLFKNKLFQMADHIFCASVDYVQNSDIKNIFSKYREKFVEIPFGVNIDFFKPRDVLREKFALFVSVLDKAHYFKGFEVLLDALVFCPPDLKLVVVGDGDRRVYFENLVKKNGLSDRVSFVGGVDNNKLLSYYQKASCFVLPSINKCEAFGLVLLEAMACACPVVASNIPGVRRVFNNSEQGFITPVGDAKLLAQAITNIVNNPDNVREMGEQGVALVHNKYSWSKSVEEMCQFFNPER